jgi:transcriptional regulator with XRE-family HTH domain
VADASYADVIVRNIRALRARKRLGQGDVVERMRNLGYTTWHRPTLGRVERGERRLFAEELLGLAAALDVTMHQLLEPQPDDQRVEFPGGASVDVQAVRLLVTGTNPHTFVWKDNVPALRQVAAGWAGDPDMPGELKDALGAAGDERDEP